jgi:subfamily B ATP-binding cassette protein MsbA
MTKFLSLFQRLKRSVSYFQKPMAGWVATVASVIILAFTEPLIPALLQQLLDKGFDGNQISIWLVPIFLIGLFGIRGICAFLAQVALAKIANTGLLKLRLAMFNRLMNADPTLFRQQNSSALTNTIIYDIQNGANLVVNSLLTLGRDTLSLIALTVYLLYLNWKLSIIVAVMLPLIALLMKAATKRIYSLARKSQEATDSLAYVVEENVLAWREVRLQQAQLSQSQRFELFGKTLDRIAFKSTVAGSAMTPLTQLFAAIALSTVISIALFQNQSDGTSIGSFASFVTAMMMLIAPIKHLSEIANPLTRGLASIERGIDLIETSLVESTGQISKDKIEGYIKFTNVSVQYPESQQMALNDISFSIHPGESIALVGSSGSGKTTLANLLPRFIQANSGDITIDDISINEWDLFSLRNKISMVSQHVVVLNDTLANNIALGQKIDSTKIIDCLIAANLGDYLSELPDGIHSNVGHNASKLSGGQRQRLAIARAMYKNAPILILDEATSALDNESERLVQEALMRLQKGKTTIVIAHRLSTIQHVDRIFVMRSGEIVETGSHSELLNKQGIYSTLFNLGSFDSPIKFSAASTN